MPVRDKELDLRQLIVSDGSGFDAEAVVEKATKDMESFVL